MLVDRGEGVEGGWGGGGRWEEEKKGRKERKASQPTELLTDIKSPSLGAGIAQLVVLGLAVHSVAGSILLWGHFPVEGIFPLELT